jgi:tetratricopeptide (TPR) repeat protein
MTMKLAIAMALAVFGAAVGAQAAFGADDLGTQLGDLGHGWAQVYYQTPESKQEELYPPLIAKADTIARANPARAEPLIWESIILSSYAKVKGGLGAVDVAEKARDFALAAVKLDDKAMDAGAYTSLGVLYYKVPGWPIGFGSDKKAKQYLDRALAIAPTAIDVNYFYGDFMIEQGDKQKARTFLEKALEAPARPGRADADAGRKQEIQADLAKISG